MTSSKNQTNGRSPEIFEIFFRMHGEAWLLVCKSTAGQPNRYRERLGESGGLTSFADHRRTLITSLVSHSVVALRRGFLCSAGSVLDLGSSIDCSCRDRLLSKPAHHHFCEWLSSVFIQIVLTALARAAR